MKADGTRCDCSLPCRLEAEIKEAQVRAKEEMMQGIQIVKEMAQQELSSQKAAYESKIKVLEAELVGGRAVFLPHQGVPSELRILGGPGASRGKRGLRGRGAGWMGLLSTVFIALYMCLYYILRNELNLNS